MRRAQLRFKSLSSWIKNVWFILIKPRRRYFFQEGRSAAWLLLLRTCKQRTCGADQNHNNIINITADFKALQDEIQTKSKALLQKKRRLEFSGWGRPAQSPAGSQPGKTWKSVFLNVNSQPEENYLKRFERAASTKTRHHWHLLMDMNRESTIVFCHLEFLRFFPSQDLHLSQVSLNH